MVIPYGRQDISDTDVAAVMEVLKSDFLTQGPAVQRFERAVADLVGAKHAVASNSATSSLHLACLALGVAPGDVVWTSPISFVASANCARYCGADVDFVDVDLKTYNMDVVKLAEKLADAERDGRLPKVVIPVDFSGQPCDLEQIRALSERYGFKVIEDASHAIGARYRGRRVGSGGFADVTVFSFHPVKIVTTGEGGVAVTDDPDVARRIARLNSHGITREASEMTGPSEGPWYYQQVELGFNYRMTDIHASLGVSQLTRLDEFLARRHALADRYDGLLADMPVVTPWRDPAHYSALHLYVVRLRLDEIGCSRREVFERLRAAGILVNLHYIPIYSQPDFAQFKIDPAKYANAETYYAEALTLPLYPTLTEHDQDFVVDVLRKSLN